MEGLETLDTGKSRGRKVPRGAKVKARAEKGQMFCSDLQVLSSEGRKREREREKEKEKQQERQQEVEEEPEEARKT